MCDFDCSIDEGFDIEECTEIDESFAESVDELSELELPSELIDEIIEENSGNVEFLSNLEGLLESGRLSVEISEIEDEDVPKVLSKRY